ncbi:hypothetical protein BQ1740_2574 [Bacillus subtilis]|nr:hypothetical protein BQ1740_2574 [Bacillus subtilis]
MSEIDIFPMRCLNKNLFVHLFLIFSKLREQGERVEQENRKTPI